MANLIDVAIIEECTNWSSYELFFFLYLQTGKFVSDSVEEQTEQVLKFFKVRQIHFKTKSHKH